MTDLRIAAQQALEALYHATEFTELYDTEHAAAVNERCHENITALRTALAQQVELVEPVAWGVDWGRDGDRACASIVKKRADGSVEIVAVEYAPYTAPPQRKPLTDEEIKECLPPDAVRLPPGWAQFARAVERKVRGEEK